MLCFCLNKHFTLGFFWCERTYSAYFFNILSIFAVVALVAGKMRGILIVLALDCIIWKASTEIITSFQSVKSHVINRKKWRKKKKKKMNIRMMINLSWYLRSRSVVSEWTRLYASCFSNKTAEQLDGTIEDLYTILQWLLQLCGY